MNDDPIVASVRKIREELVVALPGNQAQACSPENR